MYKRQAFNAAFSTFPAFLKEELIDRMGIIEISKAETVLSADIFERLKEIPLIDKYAAFQLLDDDWTGISIDLEMLQTEGFAAKKKAVSYTHLDVYKRQVLTVTRTKRRTSLISRGARD